MDFFGQQEKAKRHTRLLLLYFLIAVTLIVVVVNVVIYFFFMFLELYPYTPVDWFSNGLVYYISAGTFVLIFMGSFFRWLKLRSGGHAVAKMAGAVKIDMHTSDANQRRLIHVVEEMSIASGVPLPTLYIMENAVGINAFVAGYQPTEAVMVITAGAIENFTREEMQGVVAHEYSHILNGDMQINVRLISILAGILVISTVGHMLIPRHRRYYSQRQGKGSGGAIIILGIALLAVGYIGVFFGRLIKAAVSRQREFLADASSVQYTRNPQAIASALNTIREAASGSILNSAYAEDMSHLCFSQAFTQHLNGWLATHPPLMERIKRVDPSFLGRIKARSFNKKKTQQQAAKGAEQVSAQDADFKTNAAMGAVMGFSAALEPAAISARELTETAGQIKPQHMQFAIEIRRSFSDELMQAVHQAKTARLIIFNMILLKMNFKQGIEFLNKHLQAEEIKILLHYKQDVIKLENFQRLPLFDLLLPGLKAMNNDERAEFLQICEKLIKSDNRYTLYEFILLSLLKQHLSVTAGKDIKIKYYSFKPLQKHLQLLFSVMAHSGKLPAEERRKSYDKVAQGFALQNIAGSGLLEIKKISPENIDLALQELRKLSPLLKKNVLEACADIAMHDAQLKYTEAELLRTIADLLNCPLPPLLPQAVN